MRDKRVSSADDNNHVNNPVLGTHHFAPCTVALVALDCPFGGLDKYFQNWQLTE